MVTTTFASPLGEILLAADGRGLTGLWFEGQEHFGSTLLKEDTEHVEGADAVSGTGGMSSVSPAHGAASSVLERSWAWLNAYFAGQEPRFTPPLHMMGVIPFRLSCRAIAWWRPTDRSTDMPAGLIARSGYCGLRARTRSNARTLCITRTPRKDESLSFRGWHASRRSASAP